MEEIFGNNVERRKIKLVAWICFLAHYFLLFKREEKKKNPSFKLNLKRVVCKCFQSGSGEDLTVNLFPNDKF